MAPVDISAHLVVNIVTLGYGEHITDPGLGLIIESAKDDFALDL